MHKRQLRYLLKRLRTVPAFLFLAMAVFFGIVAIFALRANNQKMIELRDAVFMADEQNGDIEGALRNLREHVYAHMNTNLSAGENAIYPPIQLKHTYERLVAAEQSKLQETDSDLYIAATKYCEARFPAGQLANGRVQCVARYLDEHSDPGESPSSVPEDLYKFNFVSPSWSPDLAGWSLVLAGLSLLLFIIRVASEMFIKRELDR